jgi:hypothetical protein
MTGQYNHEDAMRFLAGIQRILCKTYNPGDPRNGIDKLCVMANVIARIQSTSVTTTKSVLDDARCIAAAASTGGTIVPPAIDSRPDAQGKADWLNLINQAVIRAKEGTAKAITVKVGTDVTDAVLKNADGSDFKSIDDWQLKDVLAAIVQGADHPNTANVLNQLLSLIHFSFDFCKNVNANMELLCAKAGRMVSYGVTIDETQLALVLVANINVATSEVWGREFRPALQTIHRHCAYNYICDATSISDILHELADANGVRKLTNVLAPVGTAHAVAEKVSLLSQLLQQHNRASDANTTEYASAAQLDSDSSAHRNHNNQQRDHGGGEGCNNRHRGGRGSNQSRSHVWHQPNSCQHCNKFTRHKPCPNTPEDCCYWNKKYKGYSA